MVASKRPVTRLPHPPAARARYLVVAVLHRVLSWCLSSVYRRSVKLEDLSAARVLVLKPCCLGDVVFATPLLRELRRALPEAHLTFAVGTHSRPAVANNPTLDDLLDTGPVGSGRFTVRAYVALVRRLRARRFDACLVLERSAVLALIPWLAGIPVRVGIDSGGRGFSLSVAVPARPTRPESELYLDLLRAMGGRPRSGELEYVPSTPAIERIERLMRERLPPSRPFVVLHGAGGINPGMALPRKRWPAESFRSLADRIVQAGATVVLVGSPEDRVDGRVGEWASGRRDARLGHRADDGSAEARKGAKVPEPGPDPFRDLFASFRDLRGPDATPIVDLVGELTLDELAALARRAVAYVGNDSGPSHLAEAAGANVVMLFGPSDPVTYGPRGRRAVALTAGLWCSPCFENGRVAPCANVLCMRSISVERVWNEVARCLAESDRLR